jgi:hypothetical protein
MLEILLIASGAFLLAMFCVWVYRTVSAWQASRYRTVKLDGHGRKLDVGQQQGTVDLKFNSKIGLATGSTNSRKPWGW